MLEVIGGLGGNFRAFFGNFSGHFGCHFWELFLRIILGVLCCVAKVFSRNLIVFARNSGGERKSCE